MKKINENTKVTLTVRQLKKLVKESINEASDINDNLFDQQEILKELISVAEIAIIESNKMIKSDGEDLYAQEDYEKTINRILKLFAKIEKFDVVNL